MRYFYERWMYKRGNWVPLQVTQADIAAFDIVITMPDDVPKIIHVTNQWTLANIREHFMIMGMEDIQNLSFRLNKRKVVALDYILVFFLFWNRWIFCYLRSNKVFTCRLEKEWRPH